MDKLVQVIIYTMLLWMAYCYWDIVIGAIQFVFDSAIDLSLIHI